MYKKNLLYIAAFLAVIILCVAGILLHGRQVKPVAEIYLDGQLVQRLNWTMLDQPVYIPVGGGNVVAADAGGVWMHTADCPDQLCVKQGKIQKGSLSIVCLPNRVTVTLKSSNVEVDGVAG